jgi:DNA ligase-1
MRFHDVASVSAEVAKVSGRLEKIHRLAELLRRLGRDEIEPAVAFLSGSTRQGRVGIGHAAIASVSASPPAGEPTLTIGDVDRALRQIANTSGPGASGERARRLGELLRRATVVEQGFLRRLLYGELRQGAQAGVLTDAIAHAAGVAPTVVRRAVMLQGDLPTVARIAMTEGEAGLARSTMQVMRPIQPMLAASGEDVQHALAALPDATLEYKLDGARVQVHRLGDEVRIFSRTLNDVTTSAPELVSLVRAMPVRELILDGEVIALRPDGSPQPFQTTMRRFGRTSNLDRMQRELPLTPFFFDCLYRDGQSLIDEPLEHRIESLREIAAGWSVPRIVRPSPSEADAFVDEALGHGHEGVMAKALAAPYAAGRRGAAWLKVKQARTLDLVVLAAEWGSGRRQGWLSNLHLGARDPEHHAFVMLGKTFKGMTDQMLAWQTEQLQARAIGHDGHVVHVRPELVVEIAFNEIQRSPVYPGGLALRFARVKRYRTDKTAAEADTIETVRAMAGPTSG